MPVYGKSDALSDGLGAMSQVVEGYIRGEEIAHQRAVQEREYDFRREQFEESTRRYDRSLEERMFEFDTELAFRAEQAALGREEVRFLQEDLQAEARAASEVRRTFEAEESRKQRAVDYTRIKATKDAQRARRRLEAEKNQRYRYLNYLDGHGSYNEMPKEHYKDLEGMPFSRGDLRARGGITKELENIAKDPSSRRFISEAVDAEQAADYIDLISKGQLSEESLFLQLRSSGVIESEINSGVTQGLKSLAMTKSGVASEADWDGLTNEQRNHWNQAVIRELNGMDGMERKLRQEELKMMIAETQIKAGTYPGALNPHAAEAADDGMYFMWDPDERRVVHTGKGSSALADIEDKLLQQAAEMQTWAAEKQLAELEGRDMFAEAYEDKYAALTAEMNQQVGILETLIAEDGGDPAIARRLVDEYLGRGQGGQGNPHLWGPDRGLFERAPESDGSVSQPNLDPNNPLYEDQVAYRDLEKGTKKLREDLGLAAQKTVERETLETGRKDLQRRIADKQYEQGSLVLTTTFAQDENFDETRTKADIEAFGVFAKDYLGQTQTGYQAANTPQDYMEIMEAWVETKEGAAAAKKAKAIRPFQVAGAGLGVWAGPPGMAAGAYLGGKAGELFIEEEEQE